MGKPTPAKIEKKRQRKRQQRIEANQRRRTFQAQQRRCHKFPQVVFDLARGTDPAFHSLMNEHVVALIRDHESVFPPHITAFFHRGKQDGFHQAFWSLAMQDLRATILSPGAANSGSRQDEVLTFLREALMRRLPESARLRFFPWCGYAVVPGLPEPNQILIRLGSLCRDDKGGQPIYYSPHQPKVRFENREIVPALNEHALNRICSRVAAGQWQSNYRAVTEAFTLVHDCVHYEACVLADDQVAFTFFQGQGPAADADWSTQIATIRGKPPEPGIAYYLRVGYCPALVTGRFLLAKTLLLPGMVGTPEHEAFIRPRPAERRSAFYGRVVDDVRVEPDGTMSRDVGHLIHFHANDIPQVVTFSPATAAPGFWELRGDSRRLRPAC